MIKGFVINITGNLIICASCLAWGREENPGLGNTDGDRLKGAVAVKHTDTCSPVASGYGLFGAFIPGVGQAGI